MIRDIAINLINAVLYMGVLPNAYQYAQVSFVEINLWRDRGLYSVMISTIDSSRDRPVGEIAKCLGDKSSFSACVSVEELREPLEFVRRNFAAIKKIKAEPAN